MAHGARSGGPRSRAPCRAAGPLPPPWPRARPLSAASPATRRAPSPNPHPLAAARLQDTVTMPDAMARSRGGTPAPPIATTRHAGAVYHCEQDCRLRNNNTDDKQAPFPISSTFPISAPAPCTSSGGARPPLPVAPTAKKKCVVFDWTSDTAAEATPCLLNLIV